MGKQPSPPGQGADITIPIAGEHFGAGIPIEQQPFVERRKQQRCYDDGTPHPMRRRTDRAESSASGSSIEAKKPGEYHLRSRSEMDFPEAYVPVAKALWEELTPAQREKAIHLQAIAMEKVGFEKGAPKFFIEDFDPSTGQTKGMPRGNLQQGSSTAAATDYPTGAVLGGALLGAGAVVLAAALMGQFAPLALFAGIGAAALFSGAILVFTARG